MKHACSQLCFYDRVHTWVFESEADEIKAFYQRRAPFSRDVLLSLLEVGTPLERVFALFSLGHLGYRSLLRAYLHSSDDWERWVSAMELWQRWGEKETLPVLHELVCDGLQRIEQTYEAESRDYHDWSNLARTRAIDLLGDEENPEIIALFSATLQQCWEAEHRLHALLGQADDLREQFFSWEDMLVYRLGQWQIWDTALERELPAGRLRIAQVLWALGSLRCHEVIPEIGALVRKPLLVGFVPTVIREQKTSALLSRISVRLPVPERLRSQMTERSLSIEDVKAALGRHFQLSSAEQEERLAHFPRDCAIRCQETLESQLEMDGLKKIWAQEFSFTGEDYPEIEVSSEVEPFDPPDWFEIE